MSSTYVGMNRTRFAGSALCAVTRPVWSQGPHIRREEKTRCLVQKGTATWLLGKNGRQG